MDFKTILCAGLIMLGMNACLPEPLEVKNVPTAVSRIVVSTQIIPDQSIVVFLTKSISALDAGKDSDVQALLNQILIKDATVTIQYADKTDTLFNLGNGLYGNTNTPVAAGQVYSLTIKSPSMGTVSSSTQAQEAISFEAVNAGLDKNEYDTVAVINYSLKDPAMTNFYMINVQKISTQQDLNSLLNPRLFTHVINDEAFNGTTFSEEFKVFFQHYSDGDTVAVSLTNISKDYYDYIKLRVDNRFNLASFATEPFNYPTNINNGYGYFNIQQPDIKIFVLH